MEERIKDAYFDWMMAQIGNLDKFRYRKVLRHLHNREFTYTLSMDGNRAEDGVDLRYQFATETGWDDVYVAHYLDNRPASVLEVMVALAIRCEENIMYNPAYGDRTGAWFRVMMINLGLLKMTDDIYDPDVTDWIIDRFLDRKYHPNGEGGLVKLDHCEYDLRSVEIWEQMMWYLNEVLEKEGALQ